MEKSLDEIRKMLQSLENEFDEYHPKASLFDSLAIELKKLEEPTTTLYAIRDKESGEFYGYESAMGEGYFTDTPDFIFIDYPAVEKEFMSGDFKGRKVEVVTLNITITPVEKGKVE